MTRFTNLNYRQQRAIEAIDRGSAELGVAIRVHAPNSDAVRQALQELAALTDSIKSIIMDDEI
jgi:hypothetical protein